MQSGLDLLPHIVEWARASGVDVAVGGSVAYGEASAAADVDVMLLNVSDVFSADTPPVPDGFDVSAWPAFTARYDVGHAHVFGCWHQTFPALRLECYPRRILADILRLDEFVIGRVRKGPLRPKPCVMKGTNGSSRTVTIQPEPHGGAMYSEVPNVLRRDGVLYLGMHVDRILTSTLVTDGEGADTSRLAALSEIGRQIAQTGSSDLVSSPERIFFASERFDDKRRDILRARLRSAPTT
jgi:hypothetical protein